MGQRAMATSVGTRKLGTPMMWGFGPSPDGEVLLQQPFQPGFSELSTDVPVLIGTTYHELKFCFNTLHHAPNELSQPTEQDLRLADLMSSSWAQFAHTGNPNTEGLPAWEAYTPDNGEMLVFDYNCRITHNLDRKLNEIIDRHCFKQLDEFRAKQDVNK